MRIIQWAISLIFALILAGFAIYNREITTLIWSPLHDPLNLPLHILTLSFMIAGFLIGGFLVWLNTAPIRKERKQLKKRLTSLEKQLETLDTPNNKNQEIAFFPAIKTKGTKK